MHRFIYNFFSGDWQSAAEYFTEALKVDAECTEALYNLGLASKKMNKFDSALEAFHKLQHIQRKNPQVMFQIADIYRLIEDSGASVDWLNQAHSIIQVKRLTFDKILNSLRDF